ncbi:unnamed protein product, partial [Heterosigma akashiwo]
MEFRRKLSSALTTTDRRSVVCSMPEENIFVIENYRQDKYDQDPSIDLAALEL